MSQAAHRDPGTASAEIGVRRVASGATVAAYLRSHGTLRLLAPRNHGAAAWVYTSSLGGGLVDGDALHLDVDVGADATLFLSSQSSTKVLKGRSQSTLRARVASGGLLVLWPCAVSCFGGASYVQDTHIVLERGGSALVLDAFTSGRPAHEAPWSFTSFASRTRVLDDEGAPILLDGVSLDPAALAEMGGYHAFATVLAAGPRTAELAALAPDDARSDAPPETLATAPALGSAHALPGPRFVLRVAARGPDELAARLAPLRAWLAGALGDDPFRATSPR